MTEERILVVDDELAILKLYTRALSQAGYSVQAYADAESALQYLPQKACMVCFLDLCLPQMNGLDLCRRIRKEWPMTICYAVTGYASLYELNDCRQAGFEDYFIKPVSVSILIDAARAAFAKIGRWKR